MNVLTNTGKTIRGFSFYGVPQQPEFCEWAFNEKHSRLLELFAAVPEDVDVLISHGPPFSICDAERNKQLGCRAQFDTLLPRAKPTLTCCGHIHFGHGWAKYPKLDGSTSDKYVVNSSLCTTIRGGYQPPHIITLDDTTKQVVSIELGEIVSVR